jgi:hypothetical protein
VADNKKKRRKKEKKEKFFGKSPNRAPVKGAKK